MSLPQKQGLYSPEFEHDACGVGTVVNIDGKKSNKIIKDALMVLENLDHRGARGNEENTGDGAGILIQIPDKFYRSQCEILDINLPDEGEYAVGMFFFCPEKDNRIILQAKVSELLAARGLKVLGWRDVPTNGATLGQSAKSVMPFVSQVFVGKGNIEISDSLDFEREIFIARKIIESEMKKIDLVGSEYFYVVSFSSKTVVYKGMLIPYQMKEFYIDLNDNRVESALALVHSRFSTNTFPSWERAHPYRMTIHNGEINTLRGNLNGMKAREASFKTDVFKGIELQDLMPVIDESGSDSAMFDNCLEFMYLSGRSLAESMMMMIPEPWEKNPYMDEDRKAFYKYNSCLMEPWDGPASMVCTNGTTVCATLDRNGLRPSRYYVTKSNTLVLASEVGVLDIDDADILIKERLRPGKMLIIDTEKKEIVSDEDIKNRYAKAYPYKEWLDKYVVDISKLTYDESKLEKIDDIKAKQIDFGYTFEDLQKVLGPMVIKGVDPVGAMGNDAPLAVLSSKSQLLYNYFKQMFAQVTNPPIDSIREEIVTGTNAWFGSMSNLLEHRPKACRLLNSKTPLLWDTEIQAIKELDDPDFRPCVISTLFSTKRGAEGMQYHLDNMFEQVDDAIENDNNIIILSDRGSNEEKAAIPALLVVSAIHQYLVRKGNRTKASIIIETAEAREVHHFCLLLGYGVEAVNPYLALACIEDMVKTGMIENFDIKEAQKRYMKASVKGIVKVLSKMGISTVQSYRGAQIFECVGIAPRLINEHFTGTPSRIGGIDIDIIAQETLMRHREAYGVVKGGEKILETGGVYNWRKDGEFHSVNPQTITTLQKACYSGKYEDFKKYSDALLKESNLCTLRSLLEFRFAEKPLPLTEIESVESICKRFKTGAMSYGSISQEAHECMAIAMNRIGGKSNSGEGGELPERFIPDENGDSRCSAIKQVASGRFGVSSHYLVNSKEIQIKMAQGAKPGEGGQLPGQKVYPWIAKTRRSTPGVGLISPPPHHDIYSIEDLAQLIYDLKCANKNANINVKLVSEVGVGTIAAGVAKGHADVILVSGYDGGTGAAPRTSMRHTGLPWELGLAETNQTLIINKLRNRVKLETDGKLMSGRDIAIAALLGAEEFGFATLPLITMGCIMMRVCNLDTCPVGVATQNEDLRKAFKGKPEYVVNFMVFIAQHLREIMARLGVRTVDEMIGRTDLLKHNDSISHWKAKYVDVSNLLYQPNITDAKQRYNTVKQDHKIDQTLDVQLLSSLCEEAIRDKKPVNASINIINRNRTIGTMVGAEISRLHGAEGLPDGTINLTFNGSAGQSFGAFVPKGVTMKLIGDANDYLGKGLSGGTIAVVQPKDFAGKADENILIGNVALYGATDGEAYISGVAGERFCVRNSGVRAVVEGVGEHGCEYMTGGRVLCIGKTGKNFGAGMSGGVAYILDEDSSFEKHMNKGMAELEKVEQADELKEIKNMLIKHYQYTMSKKADKLLKNWNETKNNFVKVVPIDYKRMITAIAQAKENGMSQSEAEMFAFRKNRDDKSRLSGN